MKPEATASLASIPSRRKLLKITVASLLPQVGHLNVYLNGYEDVPEFLATDKITVARSQQHGDRGDAGKFFWASEVEGYHLVCDDDLIYPGRYAQSMIEACKRYGRRAVVGLHGVTLRTPFVNYYSSRRVFHFSRSLSADQHVHVLGTGTVCYHTNTIKVHPTDFRVPNMADIWFALLGQRQQVPFVCAAHPSDWLCAQDTGKNNIFNKLRSGSAKDTAGIQTKTVKDNLPWEIYR